jgi:phospholipid/cholesterol/gamma-HCH transport system substrate-binding protein
MPDRAKVRWSQLRVGLVALAALLILAVLIFLLTSNKGVFQQTVILRVYMDDAGGMGEGAPVRLNGITVGNVDKLRLSNSTDPQRVVEFSLLLKRSYLNDIPVDSVAAISAANLLGDKFINITKGRDTRTVKPNDEIRSQQAQDIPELMAQSANLLRTLQTIVNRVDALLAGVEAGKGNIGKLIKDEQLYNRLNGIASEGQKLLTDVRTGQGTLSKLLYDDALYNEIRAPIKRVDAILADLQSGQGTAGRLLHDPALFDEAQRTLQEIRRLLADVNAGKGTAGKLLKDERLHDQISQLVARFDTTISRINAGQGTVGQLLVNPQLYESLTGASREFQSLAKDIRSNPTKFLRIKLALF